MAGIVGFSGRLLHPERAKDEATAFPPVLLLHGDQDPLVPYASMQEAADVLAELDIDLYTHTMPGTPHGISPDGLQQAYAFMADILRKAEAPT